MTVVRVSRSDRRRAQGTAVPLHAKGMNMKTTTILGIALIVLGVVAFAFEGISYTTEKM